MTAKAATTRRPSAALDAPFPLRKPLLLLALSVVLASGYRRLISGPYNPPLCALLNYNCPDWPVSGRVVSGFEEVRKEFQRNFREGEEVGSSFFAWKDGKPVVELTGGFFDDSYTKPYPEDVLQLVFSSSKAVAGIAVAHLVSTGAVSYSDRISSFWPEFGVGNKENVTLKDLMGHRAGVSYLDPSRAPRPEDILDLDGLSEMLAGQPHNFNGTTTVGYHAVTRGWYINEVVRRTDPKKRSLGAYIRDELASVLDIDYYLGLDPALHSRVSPLVSMPILHVLFSVFVPRKWQAEPIPQLMIDALLSPESLGYKVLMNSGPKLPWYELWPRGFNRKEIWMGESPSFSGMTNAKSLSRLAAVMANNGVDPVTGKVIIPTETLKEALEPLPVLHDPVLGNPIPFLTGGWGKVDKLVHGDTWIGWAGAGGSMIWWNKDENLAFAYAMNAVKLQALGDKRSWRLIKAFLEGVDRIKGRKIERILGEVKFEEAPPILKV
ncbi:beta-lactamase/transpeptidase-like protein [Powellomyces hirtus]|nr:beta-lactamase/transpeptidase-like protein [Powellomyces hirtus]